MAEGLSACTEGLGWLVGGFTEDGQVRLVPLPTAGIAWLQLTLLLLRSARKERGNFRLWEMRDEMNLFSERCPAMQGGNPLPLPPVRWFGELDRYETMRQVWPPWAARSPCYDGVGCLCQSIWERVGVGEF